MGREPNLQRILTHASNPIGESGTRAAGFNFFGGLGCADIRANPLLGLFFSPFTVALYRDDECNNSW